MNEPGVVSLHAICLAVYQYGLPGSLSFRTRAQCHCRCSREQNIIAMCPFFATRGIRGLCEREGGREKDV